ncbi:acyl-CoA dehydrogenase family protein [Nocardia miyunensis]|uniref:acyl-CoA dehydrogenase family protein n=1 Tax=Nocardia miyunensis TaxID=282684 RepID=UPI00082CC697|nr:acyl-CoA dehydrogenase family protein [Nocardia miyunensis]
MTISADVSGRRESEFLSESGERISRQVAELVPLMRQTAPEAERLGRLTLETVGALSAAGVFALTAPVELGGHAVGARDLLEVIATVGRGDGSAGWLAGTAAANNVLALAFPQQTVDEVFALADGWNGPLVVAASLFATKVGSARKVDGGWQVRGKWGFGSGCKHAAWAIVGVEFEDENGVGRGQALLSRDQYLILDDWKVMGMAATSSNSITAETEVFVPEHRFLRITDMPGLMNSLRGKYTGRGFTWSAQARVLAVTLANAANALGMARGAQDCLAEQAPARKPFNLPYPTVADMPSAQVTAGRVRAMINAAQAVLERHADAIDRRSEQGGDFTEDEANEVHMDLIFAIRLCVEAVDAILDALGSSAVSLRNPIQRFARDLRVLSTHGAMRFDPMAEINGRGVLGVEPFPMYAGGLPAV